MRKLSCVTVATYFFALATTTEVNATTIYSPYADMTINTRWDPTYQAMEPMDLLRISLASGVDHYHLAFITDAGNCQAAWGSQTSYSVKQAWGKHLTEALKNNGVRFRISFGGAAGNDLSQACTQDQLVQAYRQVIETYRPDGLDFDIENGSANVPKLIAALKTIHSQYPQLYLSFTLPVMPEGLTSSGQEVVRSAHAANLIFTVNIMAMDYGPAHTGDMGAYAIQAANAVSGFLQTLYPHETDAAIWKKIEVTPMIGINDVSSEQFTLADADTLRTFAKEHSLGGLSIWSIARDYPCLDKWASPICSGNSLQATPYEFSQRFLLP